MNCEELLVYYVLICIRPGVKLLLAVQIFLRVDVLGKKKKSLLGIQLCLKVHQTHKHHDHVVIVPRCGSLFFLQMFKKNNHRSPH